MYGNLEVANLLLVGGADPNLPGQRVLPLMTAAAVGNEKMVELLLDHKANPNCIVREGDYQGNYQGFTPLMFASMNGHLKVVKALLARGAVVSQKAKNGATATSLSRKSGHWKITQFLLDHGG
jgi:ankyrin repeat protein